MTEPARYSIAAGVDVTFVVPDMNWDDVRLVLALGKATLADDGSPVRQECYVELVENVRAFTDLSDMNHNQFCLSGLARVGLTKSAMSALFYAARKVCEQAGIAPDPYVWPITQVSTPHPGLARRMLAISNDLQMTEAFLSNEPYEACIKERVLIRYMQR